MHGDDKYTYPGSGGVLRNLLNIEDAAELDSAVNDLVTVAWAGMSRGLPAEFDRTYLRAIHAELFGEVFDWAGECRDVHLFATGTDITYFRSGRECRPRSGPPGSWGEDTVFSSPPARIRADHIATP